MRLGAALVLPVLLAGQVPEPGLIRGTLLECDAPGGELSVRISTNEVFRFRFDSKTYFEKDHGRIEAAGLRTGELVEVVAERGSGLRYARTVHVVEPPRPVRPPTSLGRLRMPRTPFESLFPRGNLTFSGLIYRVNSERVILRTREGAEQTILLRQDTRVLQDGEAGDLRNLRPNMRVFIRAGKDLYGDVEAFQIISGTILQPGLP